jgi:hypothetical protein
VDYVIGVCGENDYVNHHAGLCYGALGNVSDFDPKMDCGCGLHDVDVGWMNEIVDRPLNGSDLGYGWAWV